MKVLINGCETSIPNPCTVRELLLHHQLGNAACAVEINRTIVPKRMHSERMIQEGDGIEIVTFVGGG